MSSHAAKPLASNPDDLIRDSVLRHLYEVHRTAKGPKKVAIGIRDLQKAMKTANGYKQNEVVSNLDYLIEKGWVRRVVESRSFQTAGGTTQDAEKITYKISDIGIDRLQRASIYQRKDTAMGINITNVNGVTVVGDGNVVNTNFTDLSRVLADMRTAVQECAILQDDEKLNIVADIETLQTQLQKPHPVKSVVAALWSGIETTVTAAGFVELAKHAAVLIGPLLG